MRALGLLGLVAFVSGCETTERSTTQAAQVAEVRPDMKDECVLTPRAFDKYGDEISYSTLNCVPSSIGSSVYLSATVLKNGEPLFFVTAAIRSVVNPEMSEARFFRSQKLVTKEIGSSTPLVDCEADDFGVTCTYTQICVFQISRRDIEHYMSKEDLEVKYIGPGSTMILAVPKSHLKAILDVVKNTK